MGERGEGCHVGCESTSCWPWRIRHAEWHERHVASVRAKNAVVPHASADHAHAHRGKHIRKRTCWRLWKRQSYSHRTDQPHDLMHEHLRSRQGILWYAAHASSTKARYPAWAHSMKSFMATARCQCQLNDSARSANALESVRVRPSPQLWQPHILLTHRSRTRHRGEQPLVPDREGSSIS